MMFKYQIHLTRHQRHINTVYVSLWIKRRTLTDEEVVVWMDEHGNELYDMLVALG